MHRFVLLPIVSTLLIINLFAGCVPIQTENRVAPKNDDAQVATAWIKLYLYLIQQSEGFTPPVASRTLGYAGITLYEAVVPGLPGYQSLVGQLHELDALPQPEPGQPYHWQSVANSALAELAHELFRTTARENEVLIDNLQGQLATAFQSQADAATIDRSIEQGKRLAAAIYQWSLNDGGNKGEMSNFPLDFVPVQGAGFWQPTPPKYQRVPLQPYWGSNRTFVLDSANECDVPPPPTYSEDKSSLFYQQALEVYETTRNLTPEERTIALFWSDDPGRTLTPPGHSFALATQLLQEQKAGLALAAETYAKLGIALTDAFIGCWQTKFTYSLIRPITYIQRVIDPTWNNPDVTDPVTTPPFPEYTSGHSVQSGATATILTSLFGDHFTLTDHTQDHRGFLPRHYASFWDLAQEAAISRLYGGIHYRASIEVGLEQGRCMGEKILTLKFRE